MEYQRSRRRGSFAARLLGLRVRVPPRTWMFVCCEFFALSDIGLCDGPIVRQEESYRVCRCLVGVIRRNNNALHLQ